MASERIQGHIDRLLDEVDQALARLMLFQPTKPRLRSHSTQRARMDGRWRLLRSGRRGGRA